LSPPILARRIIPPPVRRRWLAARSGLPTSGRLFGIGLSRTGTMSLTRALTALGFRSIHFPDDERTMKEVMGCLDLRARTLRLAILKRYDAATDTPICATFEALDAAYPGSRFILTTREKASWLDSCRRYWASWIEPYLGQGDAAAAYMTAIHESLYGVASFDEGRFSRAYDDYHARVRGHFAERPADLLDLNITAGDGWEPLCEFLNAPHPRAEFPWEQNR
jgi:sulfotransferase family protein